MEDQKASDDSDQQKKVKFDENEQKQQQEQKERKQDSRQEKSPNQDKDNKKDIQDVEDDEDGSKAVTDDQKKDKQPVTFESDITFQNQQQNTSTRNEDQPKSEDQGQTSSTYTPLTDEEKLNSENMEANKENDKSRENAQTDDTKSSNTNQRQTNSYSLNSRQRKESRRESEGSDSGQADTKQTKEEPKYETDDDKVTKQDVKSPTRSTKSNNSAKYMNWEDDKSENASLKEEVNQDSEPEETKENKTTKSNENKDKTDDDKPKSQTRTEDNQTNETQKSPDSPKSKKPRQESPKHVNTVTLVTQRQSTTTRKAPPPQDQKKNTNDRRQMSKSATYPTRKQTTPRGTSSNARDSSRASTARSYRPPSRPRTSMGFDPERRKENDFFHKELQRLKDSLRKESKTIKKPKVRDHYPDVFTSLAPYYNTYTANYLIKMPDLGYKEKQPAEAKKDEEEKDIMYTTRCTAIGLCDPWHSLNMDRSVLPKLETAEIRKKRIERMHASDNKPKSARASSNTDRNSQSQQKRPEAKQGSTRLPKFPVIAPPSSDLTTKELHYGDVPMLRDEMMKSFSHYGEDRKQSDYERTRQDFFRMELDRLAEYHPTTRPHMRAAYFAYLQNTPGSRKAIYDCMKEMNKPKKKEEQSPQAVA